MAGAPSLDRAASVPLAALGLLLLVRTHGGTSTAPLEVLTTVLGTLAVVSAARMWCRSCFESHLLGTLVALASTVGQLLAVAVGPPGGSSVAWTPDRLAVSVLGILALVLLTTAGRSGRRDGTFAARPYAR